MWQDRDRITGQSTAKSLVIMAVPTVLSTFFSVIFEVIDMFWIGRLGADSIAAMSAASFFIWMLRGLSLTVATGTIALVSRRTGEKNEEGLLRTISYAIGSTFVYAILIIIIFFPIALNIYRWIKLEPAVAGLAQEYVLIFLSGLILVYLMATLEFIIRGLGDTRLPMIIMGISLFLNILLAPLFIFTFGMGMKGAAYATVTSQGIGTVLMAGALLKKLPELMALRFTRKFFSIKVFLRQFISIVSIGGLVGLSDALFSVIYLFLSAIISIFGKEPLGAVGIAHRLESLGFFICLGFSMAVAPLVGQYLGAGMIESAKKVAVLSLKITIVILLVLTSIYFTFAPFFFKLFTNDPLIIKYGVEYLRIVVLFDVFLSFEVVLDGVFSGAGDTKPPFLITFPITFLRVPGSYFLAVVLKLGTPGIWVMIAFTTFLKGSLMYYVFRKGNWVKKKV